MKRRSVQSQAESALPTRRITVRPADPRKILFFVNAGATSPPPPVCGNSIGWAKKGQAPKCLALSGWRLTALVWA